MPIWPFSKKRRAENPGAEPRPDDWLIAQGERDGYPMIVRMANAYRGLAPLPGYDHHLIVSVSFRNPQPNGFPPSEEGDDLERVEVALCSLLEAENDTLCVLVITNNGLRDFIFQTRNAESLKAKLDTAGPIFRGFKAEIALEPDADWAVYKAFDKMLGSGS